MKIPNVVVVAMSGGVDSSVTAALLSQKYKNRLHAVYMSNWDTRDEHGACPSEEEWEMVKKTCTLLRIPSTRVNFSKEYWTRVFENVLLEYERGRTPNPDVACNREIKFGALHDWVQREFGPGVMLATGHYARLRRDREGRPRLYRGLDRRKDQSYFLASVHGSALSRALFPLGHMRKEEVKQIATEWHLPAADRKESMGICFVGKRRKFASFLSEYIPEHPGLVMTPGPDGIILGRHRGLYTTTIGQRISICYASKPWYLAQKRFKENVMIAVDDSEHPMMYSTRIHTEPFHWLHPCPEAIIGKMLLASTRYQQTPVPCRIVRMDNHGLTMELVNAMRAITPGQVCVLWDDHDECIGSGVIRYASSAPVFLILAWHRCDMARSAQKLE